MTTRRPAGRSEPAQPGPADPIETIEAIDPARSLTYVRIAPVDGDLETGDVLLDQVRIGRLSRRWRSEVRPGRPGLPPDPSTEAVWHAEAVGWTPHQGRPWDRRITSTAPTRRRAAEDLLRAYRNQR